MVLQNNGWNVKEVVFIDLLWKKGLLIRLMRSKMEIFPLITNINY